MKKLVACLRKRTLLIVILVIIIGLWGIKKLLPPGHDIIFTSGYKIYSINADGSNKSLLANWFDVHSPNLSPDKSRIVYMGKPNLFGSSEIYTMQVNGSNKTRLTHNDEFESSPVWSPDGTQIAFAAHLEGTCICQNIYIMDINDSTITRLTNNKKGDGLIINLANDSAPIWSPDGKQIVFERDWYYDKTKLYMVNVDGTNLTSLTHHLNGEYDPVWSPDGTKIIFVSTQNTNAEIYTTNMDNLIKTRLTNNYIDDKYPIWSPDGTKIAFVSGQDNKAEIYIISLDDLEEVRLTYNNTDEKYPVWSPDGTEIAFVSEQGDGIYIIDVNNPDQIRLISKGTRYTSLSWQP